MTRSLAIEQHGEHRFLRVRGAYFSLRSKTIYWYTRPHGLREIDLLAPWRGLGRKLQTLVRVVPFRASASSEMDVWDDHGLRGTGF